MGAMVTVHVETQVEADVQRLANEVLKREGLTLEQALQELLVCTAQEGALPFSRDSSPEGLYGADDPAYDAWFRAKVQEALDDPRPGIPHEEVRRRMAGRRAEAMAKLR